MNHSESSYLDLLSRLLVEGDERVDRTGVGTRALFGCTLRFDLSDGFPAFTTKQLFWKTAFKEMLWMLSGGRNVRELLQQDVHIWTPWPLKRYREVTGSTISQQDFECRILNEPEFAEKWGDLGPLYGSQWRRWRGSDGQEIDQIALLVEGLKRDPTSRRLLFEGWNVAEIDKMVLPPCHKTYQFFVSPSTGKLSAALMQRSADAFIGLSWNIANLALLTHLLSEQCGYVPGEIVWFGCDVHLYLNHQKQAREQITRVPRPFPCLVVHRKPKTLFEYTIDDFYLANYSPYPPISAELAV